MEGYPESAATGIIAGMNAARLLEGKDPIYPPETTMIGALLKYITEADPKSFQPMNANFGLIKSSVKIRNKLKRRKVIAEMALETMKKWKEEVES